MNAADKMRFQKAQLDYFCELSSLRKDETHNLLVKFAGLCRQLDRINEKDCNEGLKPQQEVEQGVLVAEAEMLAKELGCKLYYQGDPRGPAIRLIRPDGRSNVMDGETWHVKL